MTQSNSFYDENYFSVGSTPCRSLCIKCEQIMLHQSSLNIAIEINDEILNNIRELKINGFKFIKVE